MAKVAVIGTQGVPARYGGFESLAENLIGADKSQDIEYTVFCSSKDCTSRPESYKGATLKYIPFHANGAQSIIYDILSMMSCQGRKYDAVLILGVSGCIFLPVFKLFYRKRTIVNIDGLEHRRDKWNRFAKWFLRKSEAVAVRNADVIIADNRAIQEYVEQTYGRNAEVIAYGGDQVIRPKDEVQEEKILAEYSLKPKGYAVSVCRIEPENNCHLTLEAFSRSGSRLVFIGNWEKSEYGRKLKEEYSSYPNITVLDPIYDLGTLNVLRSNAEVYVHGHSAGGTNPSLVEAMFYGIPVLAFDVPYNRYTTFDKASYWHDADELLRLLQEQRRDGTVLQDLAKENYTWKKIVGQYERLYCI